MHPTAGSHPDRRGRRPRFSRAVLGAALAASTLFWAVATASAQPWVTFAAAGDHGSGSAASASLRQLASAGAAFYLALGDLSYGSVGDEASWCNLVHSAVGPTYPFQLVSGNHEDDARPNGFIDSFTACLPDRMGSQGRYGAEYYFDYAGLLRVIMIAPDLTIGGESYRYVPGDPHYAWLAQRIDDARAAGITWIVVGMHKVCITAATKSCEIGTDLMDLLISRRVDLVLQGHDHTYQRSKQLTCAHANSFVASCVADDGSDGAYSKGSGTVFVIAGAFGQSFYAVDSGDPEAGYFARLMGSNVAPTYGFVKYTVSPTQLTAEYVGTSAGAFTDAFTITSSPAPPAAPTGLTVR